MKVNNAHCIVDRNNQAMQDNKPQREITELEMCNPELVEVFKPRKQDKVQEAFKIDLNEFYTQQCMDLKRGELRKAG